jgi:L-fuculokinase
MKVIAIFDIGKTNKKFFLFDKQFREVFKSYERLEEIHDDDGFPSDNLPAIKRWMQEQFRAILHNEEYEIQSVNFSTYGASFVHIGRDGTPVAPLYNYLKPFPADILESFYKKYGEAETIARQTASPPSGMLNSGFQLYWLKYAKPDIFNKIRYSVHFPQYLSYLFTGIPVSDYTSTGCHTSLWDYEKEDYHDWVYAEGIDKKLPPIINTRTSINTTFEGRPLRTGIGIHDSSAALLPYLKSDPKPFLLISTGTWSISLNPFNESLLTREELDNNCLHYMRIDGSPVKAARFFLGNEYKLQVRKLQEHFGKKNDHHRRIKFDEAIFLKLHRNFSTAFHFESLFLKREQPAQNELDRFATFEEAFHQLMMELVKLQLRSARMAIGNTPIRKVYVDGGFADNEVYVKLLAHHFNDYKLRTTRSPLGSALGAALVLSGQELTPKFLKKHYRLRKHDPLILKP